MIAKAQRKISAAGAAEITDDVIKIAEQKHRDKLQEAIKPIKTVNYTSGIYDCRNEILTNNIRKNFGLMMMIHGSLKAGTTKTASCAFEKISINLITH